MSEIVITIVATGLGCLVGNIIFYKFLYRKP